MGRHLLRTRLLPLGTTLLIALLALEALLSRGDAERYPAPGRMVDVAGSSFHLQCTGHGSPTAVLEAGLGEPGLTWAEVQVDLAPHARVCSYDRQGLGWSAPGTGTWSASTAATQLLSLLGAAKEVGPFVLVGHSLGSFVVRELYRQHPEVVAGRPHRRPATSGRRRLPRPRRDGTEHVALGVGEDPPPPVGVRPPMHRAQLGEPVEICGAIQVHVKVDPSPGSREFVGRAHPDMQ